MIDKSIEGKTVHFKSGGSAIVKKFLPDGKTDCYLAFEGENAGSFPYEMETGNAAEWTSLMNIIRIDPPQAQEE